MTKHSGRSKGSHRRGGLTAKRKGAATEREFDEGSNYYWRMGQLSWEATYPEFVPLGQHKGYQYGYFKAKSSPDRIVSITELGGRACWIEIKAVKGKDKKTFDRERDNLHQFGSLKNHAADGSTLAYYATRWEYKREIEWRLYPIGSLALNEDGNLTLFREDGLYVGSPLGWPEWLPVVIQDVAMRVLDQESVR